MILDLLKHPASILHHQFGATDEALDGPSRLIVELFLVSRGNQVFPQGEGPN
jgi:hypothetical protein